MEALRLFMPDLYRAIRANPDRLTGYMSIGMGRNTRDLAPEYSEIFVANVPEKEREQVRRTLRRLFPKLDAIWANVYHQADGSAQRFRRVCSAEHFNTYFRFAIGEDVLPAAVISAFIAQAGNGEFVQNTLREALKVKLQSGHTRASSYLEQIRVHADRIPKEHVAEFIKSPFEIGDDLDVQEDEGRGFYAHGDNGLRLWFLIRAVLPDRFDQAERSSLIATAIESAQLYTLVTFAERCSSQYDKQSYDDPLVDAATSGKLIGLARDRLRAAAKDGSLATHRRLFSLLWAWTRTGDGALDEVKEGVKASIGDDQFVLHLASSAAGMSWSMPQGFDGRGELVSRGRLHVQRSAVSPLIDEPTFLARLKEIAAKTENTDEAAFVGVFMEAWENADDREPAMADTARLCRPANRSPPQRPRT